MTNKAAQSKLIQELALKRRPIAITLAEEVPEGLPAFQGSVAAGCTFWRLAAEGRSFYTLPSDHYNCPIGSYTHNIALPETREGELPQMLDVLSNIGYLRMEEVPGMAQLQKSPKYIIYSTLADAPGEPDVVLLSGSPGKLMLLNEASIRAGAYAGLPLLARPTCMAVPLAMESGTVSSAGCAGNRVYTELSDNELYTAIRGTDLEAILTELSTVVSANATLNAFHSERRRQLETV